MNRSATGATLAGTGRGALSSGTSRQENMTVFIPSILKSILILPPIETDFLTNTDTPTLTHPVTRSSTSYSFQPYTDSSPTLATHDPPSQVPCTPVVLPPIIVPSLTYEIEKPMSSGTVRGFQTTFSTVTSTVTETPVSTFPAPVSTNATNVTANPMHDTSAALPVAGQSFFDNHPAVISVFLISGMAIMCIVALALLCCLRRQRQTRRRGKRLQDMEISPPLQNPFSMREHSSPHGYLDSLVRPAKQTAVTQSLSRVPLNRSEDSIMATQSIADAPLLPPPPSQRLARSSHRVPVPYAVLSAQGSDSRTTNWQYTNPFSDYHAVRIQTLPSSNVPPPPPKRSPLRSLASKNSLAIPQENLNRLSQASSGSLYPPSSYRSDAEMDSLYLREVGASRDTHGASTRGLPPGNNSGMEQREKVNRLFQAAGLSGVASNDVSSNLYSGQGSLQLYTPAGRAQRPA